jgi:hypothetical protein
MDGASRNVDKKEGDREQGTEELGGQKEHGGAGDGIVLVLSDESSDDTSAFAALVEQVVGLMSYPVVTRVSRS